MGRYVCMHGMYVCVHIHLCVYIQKERVCVCAEEGERGMEAVN